MKKMFFFTAIAHSSRLSTLVLYFGGGRVCPPVCPYSYVLTYMILQILYLNQLLKTHVFVDTTYYYLQQYTLYQQAQYSLSYNTNDTMVYDAHAGGCHNPSGQHVHTMFDTYSSIFKYLRTWY